MSAPVEQLSCQELVELVTDYLEGSLSPEERARFDEHLGVCEGCRRYLAQIEATVRVDRTPPRRGSQPGGRAGAARCLPALEDLLSRV